MVLELESRGWVGTGLGRQQDGEMEIVRRGACRGGWWGGEVRGVAGTSVCGWLGPVAGRGKVDCRCVQGGILGTGAGVGVHNVYEWR